MKRKSYLIIGVGRFSIGVMRTLSSFGIDILVVDNKPEKLDLVSSFVTRAVCADASNPEVLQNLGVSNFDGAIVTVGEHLEMSVLITMQLKEMGVPFILVKAFNELEGRLLRKVGADRVVFPEREMGIHIGNELAHENPFEAIELSDEYSIVDLSLPASWRNKTLIELNVRARYGISVIGIRRNDNVIINPEPGIRMLEGDILIILGDNMTIEEMQHVK
mgnify:CR=1 FL=1